MINHVFPTTSALTFVIYACIFLIPVQFWRAYIGLFVCLLANQSKCFENTLLCRKCIRIRHVYTSLQKNGRNILNFRTLEGIRGTRKWWITFHCEDVLRRKLDPNGFSFISVSKNFSSETMILLFTSSWGSSINEVKRFMQLFCLPPSFSAFQNKASIMLSYNPWPSPSTVVTPFMEDPLMHWLCIMWKDRTQTSFLSKIWFGNLSLITTYCA